MPQPTNERPTPPAPRLHRLLSHPIGWLAFLLLEAALLFGLITVLPLERVSRSVALPLEVLLIVGAVIVNYGIRRTYLSDWWEDPGR